MQRGWREPDLEAYPTGAELWERYLLPLSSTPEIAAALETSAEVVGISRQGIDKVSSKERATYPFVLQVSKDGVIRRDLASAVVDASGTWSSPNPLGADGLPAPGERETADRIRI